MKELDMQDEQLNREAGFKAHRAFKSSLVMWLAIFLPLQPVAAFAYLDPTTGSMIISAIVGLFASLVLAIKTYWYRLKSFFKGKPAENEKKDEGV